MIFRRRPRKPPAPEPEPPRTTFLVQAARVLVELLDRVEGVDELLCLPCRDGGLVLALAQVLPRTRITGIDPSTELTRRAAEQALREGVRGRVEFRTSPLRRLPLADGLFRFVVAPGLLAGEANPDLVLREVARVLSPGGQMLLLEPAEGRNPPAVDPQHLEEWIESSPLAANRAIERHAPGDGPAILLASLSRS